MWNGSMYVAFLGNQLFHLVISTLSGIETESCHDANFVGTDVTVGCYYENL